ncbi:inositol monophosphatase family protein, partial [Candidatus Omnitrophota bacterium]
MRAINDEIPSLEDQVRVLFDQHKYQEAAETAALIIGEPQYSDDFDMQLLSGKVFYYAGKDAIVNHSEEPNLLVRGVYDIRVAADCLERAKVLLGARQPLEENTALGVETNRYLQSAYSALASCIDSDASMITLMVKLTYLSRAVEALSGIAETDTEAEMRLGVMKLRVIEAEAEIAFQAGRVFEDEGFTQYAFLSYKRAHQKAQEAVVPDELSSDIQKALLAAGMRLGDDYLEKEEFLQAIEVFDCVLGLDEVSLAERFAIYAGLIQAQSQRGNFPEAIAVYGQIESEVEAQETHSGATGSIARIYHYAAQAYLNSNNIELIKKARVLFAKAAKAYARLEADDALAKAQSVSQRAVGVDTLFAVMEQTDISRSAGRDYSLAGGSAQIKVLFVLALLVIAAISFKAGSADLAGILFTAGMVPILPWPDMNGMDERAFMRKIDYEIVDTMRLRAESLYDQGKYEQALYYVRLIIGMRRCDLDFDTQLLIGRIYSRSAQEYVTTERGYKVRLAKKTRALRLEYAIKFLNRAIDLIDDARTSKTRQQKQQASFEIGVAYLGLADVTDDGTLDSIGRKIYKLKLAVLNLTPGKKDTPDEVALSCYQEAQAKLKETGVEQLCRQAEDLKKQGSYELSLELLREAANKARPFPQSMRVIDFEAEEILVLYGSSLINGGQTDKGIEVLELTYELSHLNTVDRMFILARLVEAYFAKADYISAIAKAEEASYLYNTDQLLRVGNEMMNRYLARTCATAAEAYICTGNVKEALRLFIEAAEFYDVSGDENKAKTLRDRADEVIKTVETQAKLNNYRRDEGFALIPTMGLCVAALGIVAAARGQIPVSDKVIYGGAVVLFSLLGALGLHWLFGRISETSRDKVADFLRKIIGPQGEVLTIYGISEAFNLPKRHPLNAVVRDMQSAIDEALPNTFTHVANLHLTIASLDTDHKEPLNPERIDEVLEGVEEVGAFPRTISMKPAAFGMHPLGCPVLELTFLDSEDADAINQRRNALKDKIATVGSPAAYKYHFTISWPRPGRVLDEKETALLEEIFLDFQERMQEAIIELDNLEVVYHKDNLFNDYQPLLVVAPQQQIEATEGKSGMIINLRAIIRKALSLAKEQALEAGKVCLEARQGFIESDEKADDGTLVSKYDRLIERNIITAILSAFPGHDIIAEEDTIKSLGFLRNPDSDFLWLIDPIDGTRPFIGKDPLGRNNEFTVVISLLYRGRPLLSVVNAPAYRGGVLYYASEIEEGAFLQSDERVSKIEADNQSPLSGKSAVIFDRSLEDLDVKFKYDFLPDEVYDELNRGFKDVSNIPTSGTFAQCMVAEGSQAVFMHPSPAKAYDVIPGAYIVKKAKGMAVYPDGEDVFPVAIDRHSKRPRILGQIIFASQPAFSFVQEAIRKNDKVINLRAIARKALSLAKEQAIKAGEICLEAREKLIETEAKDDGTIFTEYDGKIEGNIITAILSAFPDHDIIAEEDTIKSLGFLRNPDSDFLWLIDSIDGTKPFAFKDPLGRNDDFANVICLLYKGYPLMSA